jgi:hypothetical protein
MLEVEVHFEKIPFIFHRCGKKLHGIISSVDTAREWTPSLFPSRGDKEASNLCLPITLPIPSSLSSFSPHETPKPLSMPLRHVTIPIATKLHRRASKLHLSFLCLLYEACVSGCSELMTTTLSSSSLVGNAADDSGSNKPPPAF